MARGAVTLVAPDSYCIDPKHLRLAFALMARCDVLGGGLATHRWALSRSASHLRLRPVACLLSNRSSRPETSIRHPNCAKGKDSLFFAPAGRPLSRGWTRCIGAVPHWLVATSWTSPISIRQAGASSPMRGVRSCSSLSVAQEPRQARNSLANRALGYHKTAKRRSVE